MSIHRSLTTHGVLMGRKTKTIVAFFVALTCATRSNGKRYADRSDQDPSTYFPLDENIFASGIEELAKAPADDVSQNVEERVDLLEDGQTFATASPFKSEAGYTGYRRSAYKGDQVVKHKPPSARIPTIKYNASSRYTASFRMETLTQSEQERPVYSESTNMFVPAKVPATDAVPLKGILRKEPWPAKSALTKKVQIRKRVSVLFYDPKDGTLSKRPIGPIQKCGTFDDGGGSGGGRFKSTRTLRQSLRHLFYQ